jgi:transposase-like protein
MVEDFLQKLGTMTLELILEASASTLAGKPHQGAKGGPIRRHGTQKGSVRLGAKKVAVERPRLRTKGGSEVAIPAYETLKSSQSSAEKVHKAMLSGLSTRNARAVLDDSMEAVGLSKSSLSRSFQEVAAKRLDELLSRRFETRMLGIMIDGMHIGDHVVIAAIGIDERGHKQVLGIAEGSTEHSSTVKSLLVSLLERGVDPAQRALFVIDGGKALAKGIREIFGAVPIQRCRVHKLRNVQGRLPVSKQKYVGSVMRAAYKLPFEEGLRRMRDLARELEVSHPGAAASLLEGLEETFTVSRLGLPPELIRALGTTNLIESSQGGVRRRLRRVTNVQSGQMALRWAASALLDAEPSMRTLKGYRHLWMLRSSLDSEIAECAV